MRFSTGLLLITALFAPVAYAAPASVCIDGLTPVLNSLLLEAGLDPIQETSKSVIRPHSHELSEQVRARKFEYRSDGQGTSYFIDLGTVKRKRRLQKSLLASTDQEVIVADDILRLNSKLSVCQELESIMRQWRPKARLAGLLKLRARAIAAETEAAIDPLTGLLSVVHGPGPHSGTQYTIQLSRADQDALARLTPRQNDRATPMETLKRMLLSKEYRDSIFSE